jgi:hypothetical protein
MRQPANLERLGIRTKERKLSDGRIIGGIAFGARPSSCTFR